MTPALHPGYKRVIVSSERPSMPRVDSSAMFRLHYEEAARELDVTFTSGKTYTYFEVPKDVYQDFLTAASKGEFVNAHVKDRYRFAPRARDWRRKR
jgi:KTSC domain-containing protein